MRNLSQCAFRSELEYLGFAMGDPNGRADGAIVPGVGFNVHVILRELHRQTNRCIYTHKNIDEGRISVQLV